MIKVFCPYCEQEVFARNRNQLPVSLFNVKFAAQYLTGNGFSSTTIDAKQIFICGDCKDAIDKLLESRKPHSEIHTIMYRNGVWICCACDYKTRYQSSANTHLKDSNA